MLNVLASFWDIIVTIFDPSSISLGLTWGLMTLGVYLTFRVLNIADMTCDGSFVLGGAVCSSLIVAGWNPAAALLIAFLSGLCSGFVTGFLHTKFKMHELLAGILTMTGLYSINIHLMGKPNINLPLNSTETVFDYVNKVVNAIASAFAWIGNLFVGDGYHYVPSVFKLSQNACVIIIGLIIVAVIVAVLYWFCGTEIGSALRATGSNPNMVRAMGVNTDTMKIMGLMISNALIAFSGALVVQQQRFSDANMGTGTLVQGLAAIVIGEAVLGWAAKKKPFWFTLASVIVGTYIYRRVIALVLMIGLPPLFTKLLTANIVALALAIPVIIKETKKYVYRGYYAWQVIVSFVGGYLLSDLLTGILLAVLYYMFVGIETPVITEASLMIFMYFVLIIAWYGFFRLGLAVFKNHKKPLGEE